MQNKPTSITIFGIRKLSLLRTVLGSAKSILRSNMQPFSEKTKTTRFETINHGDPICFRKTVSLQNVSNDATLMFFIAL